ncbi:MAG: type II toxin-antitoxin system Phd/YefM family antitoxin [Firmicutes bacterium]|nr:type II toxin-antitoxin system Phd/YefM family antitoxin [Bacillota bacterium]
MEVTSTEIQNNFGTYLKLAQIEEVFITRNGKRIAVLRHWEEPPAEAPLAAEAKANYRPERSGLTVEEFRKLAEAGEARYEYIDGEIYLLASPSWEHQRIILEIAHYIQEWSRGKKCKPVTAPFDVTLMKDEKENIVQPDIIVVCDPEKIDEHGRYTGVPSLVVEVLSETTRNKDMLKKLDLYMAGGVGEYWIVNPENREIYIYSFAAGEIRNYRVFKGAETAASEVLEGLAVPLEQVFSAAG